MNLSHLGKSIRSLLNRYHSYMICNYADAYEFVFRRRFFVLNLHHIVPSQSETRFHFIRLSTPMHYIVSPTRPPIRNSRGLIIFLYTSISFARYDIFHFVWHPSAFSEFSRSRVYTFSRSFFQIRSGPNKIAARSVPGSRIITKNIIAHTSYYKSVTRRPPPSPFDQ